MRSRNEKQADRENLSCTCKLKVDTHKSVGVYFFRGKKKKRR